MKQHTVGYILGTLGVVFLALALTACGSSGGGNSSPASVTPFDTPPADNQPVTVSGVAATGAPMAGNVYLKDSDGTELAPAAINSDGSFTFDVDGLTAPFYLYAGDNAGNTLYSIAMGPGIANINPFTSLALAAAAGVHDPRDVFNGLLPVTQTDLDRALHDLRNVFLYLLWLFDADVNPFTDPFAADHTGLDALFDYVKVEIIAGTAFFNDVQGNSLGQVFTSSLLDSSSANVQVTGNGYNKPDSDNIAILSLNVDESSLGTGQVSYAYKQIGFSSDVITGISFVGGSVTVTGVGTANELAGYTFSAVITDGNPDAMGMEIRKPDGSLLMSTVSRDIIDGIGYTVTNN